MKNNFGWVYSGFVSSEGSIERSFAFEVFVSNSFSKVSLVF
jgi:hypothetical protein